MIAPTAGVPLAPRTTLGLGGAADWFVRVSDEDALRSALAWAHDRALAVTVLGGGSNVVVDDAGVRGLVVQLAMAQHTRTVRDDGRVAVTVGAGVSWDDFVRGCVGDGLAGVECLVGIPGSVGATPVQNVGAYGQEVSDTIECVRVMDRVTGAVREIPHAECGFAYRDSVFKRDGRSVVTAVTFALVPDGTPTVRYAELDRALGDNARTLAYIRDTVVRLRRAKGMVYAPDEPEGHTAGSFFTNPVVSARDADAVVARARASGIAGPVPRFDAGGGRVKLAAGWLIEHAGCARGERAGAVGISSRHALALVHHGGGTTRELLALAQRVRDRVREAFGVELVMEPVVLR